MKARYVLLVLLCSPHSFLDDSYSQSDASSPCEFSFPSDVSVGILLLHPISADNKRQGSMEIRFDARGTFWGPCRNRVTLIVDRDHHHQLSYLSQNMITVLDLRHVDITDGMAPNIAGCKSLEKVLFGPCTIKETVLRSLIRLPQLQSLDLRRTDIDESGLRVLSQNPSIRRLYLQETKIDDEDIEELVAFRNLEHVALPSQISDMGLKWICEISNLEGLYLAETSISNKGLSELKQCRTLKLLNLSGTSVSEDGIVALNQLDSLETLDLSATHVGDLSYLSEQSFQKLRYLNLAETSIGDADLKKVGSLTSLRTLNLSYTKVRGSGCSKLRTLKRLEELDLTGLDIDSRHLGFVMDLEDLQVLLIPDARMSTELTDKLMHHETLNHMWLDTAIDVESVGLLRKSGWILTSVPGVWEKRKEES